MPLLKIPFHSDVNENNLLDFLNNQYDSIRDAYDTDVSHLLIGTIAEKPKVTKVSISNLNKIKIEYRFKWYVDNACLNIKDEGYIVAYFIAKLTNDHLIFEKSLSSKDRSTHEEF